jgi:hypothetical protein
MFYKTFGFQKPVIFNCIEVRKFVKSRMKNSDKYKV